MSMYDGLLPLNYELPCASAECEVCSSSQLLGASTNTRPQSPARYLHMTGVGLQRHRAQTRPEGYRFTQAAATPSLTEPLCGTQTHAS